MDKKLLDEIEERIPKLQGYVNRFGVFKIDATKIIAGTVDAVIPLMGIVLEQQKEIDALKQEIELLKRQSQ